MLASMRQMQKMGPMGQVMSMIPGMGGMAKEAQDAVDRGDLRRVEAIILSMTPRERREPGVLNASRRRRIANGSGTTLPEVNRLDEAVRRDAEAHEAAFRGRWPPRRDGPDARPPLEGVTTMTDQDPTQAYTPPPGEPPVPRRRPPDAPVAPAADVAPTAAYVAPRPRRPRTPPRPRPRCRPSPRRRLPRPAWPPRRRDAAPATKRRSPLKWVAAARRRRCSSRARRSRPPLLLTGASGTPAVLAWAPADSVTYAEVRLDLPGNQQAELAKVMQRLPGLRGPGRVPDQDQRGARPARRQGLGRQAELHGRHRALVRRPAQRERRPAARRAPTPRRPARCALASVKDAAKATAWAASTLAAVRRHLHDRDLQRRHDHRDPARRPTSA